MTMKFLSPQLHGALDYLAAGALIVLPMLLGLSGIAFWLSVGGGIGLIAYSLLTDYRFGAIKLVSFDVHLLLDLAAGAAFIVAPFALGFDSLTSIYYFVMAAGVIAVVAFTSRAAKA
ncbi:MAG: hypothetical protein H2054_11555 [Sphingomonas sp.]|nr:hypothetical protein [Sphingomonas sp.]